MIIKKLDSECYSSVSVLLDKIVARLKTLGIPYLVDNEGKLMIISESGGVITMATLDNDYIITLSDDGKIEDLVTDLTHYQILPNHKTPIVSKQKLLEGTMEQFYYENPNTVAHPYAHYYQMNSMGEECEFVYDINDYKRILASYLYNYLPNKSANVIDLKTYKRLISKLIYKGIDEFFLSDSGEYSKNLFPRLKKIRILNNSIPYEEDSILKVISSRHFNTSVDNELIEMLTHNNKKINELENILEGYNNIARR